MENSYIKDYIENLLENTFENDLERLKSIMYGIDYILNNLQFNLETAKDKNNYNRITTCYLIIKEIIENEEEKKYQYEFYLENDLYYDIKETEKQQNKLYGKILNIQQEIEKKAWKFLNYDPDTSFIIENLKENKYLKDGSIF